AAEPLAGRPHWEATPQTGPYLSEFTLPSAAPEQILRFAAQALSTPRDLCASPPLWFHVLHGPDGRDRFLMQYNHAALDNNAAVLLVRAIDRAFRGDELVRVPDTGDAILRYLRRTPRSRRRQAVGAVIEEWRRWQRGGVVMLGGSSPRSKQIELRVAKRT